MNQTLRKFGYPDSLIADYPHWVVLLRPAQVTLGSLVLASKSDATAFSALAPEAFATLSQAVSDIEATLGGLFTYDKINYLMLMMVDPHVHFHVFPRYQTARDHNGTRFVDAGWPGVPDLSAVTELTESGRRRLRDDIRATWPAND